MKLFELKKGDIFVLAGDDESPIFVVSKQGHPEVKCHLNASPFKLESYAFSPFTPVIHIKEGDF